MGKRIMGRIPDVEGVTGSARMACHSVASFRGPEKIVRWGIAVVASVRQSLPSQAPERTRDLHLLWLWETGERDGGHAMLADTDAPGGRPRPRLRVAKVAEVTTPVPA